MFRSSTLLVLIFCLTTGVALGQKLVRKSVLNERTTHVDIDAGNCFSLTLLNSSSDEVIVRAQIEGEYTPDLLLSLEQDGGTMHISTGFRPDFQLPNDKLGAHKVISIALEVEVPRYRSVKISGTNCNVNATGRYSELDIALDDGSCTLVDVEEKVRINTQSGDIIVESAAGQFLTETRYGKLYREKIPSGDSRFDLSTATGDIRLYKILK